MVLCRAASPSQTASSKDAFWPAHCFPSSSALCSMRQKKDLPDGIYIRFLTDGSLFNLRRLLARTKTIEELITELLFAEDHALLAHTEEALQHIVNRFSDAAKSFGLTISLKKTAAKEKRRRQKERASHPSSSQTVVCPKCGRGCASRIGLYSHQRACKN